LARIQIPRKDDACDGGNDDARALSGGGYCFAPTHSLQDNSPTENVVAMYEAAHAFGAY
jgi:hypothetical protein